MITPQLSLVLLIQLSYSYLLFQEVQHDKYNYPYHQNSLHYSISAIEAGHLLLNRFQLA